MADTGFDSARRIREASGPAAFETFRSIPILMLSTLAVFDVVNSKFRHTAALLWGLALVWIGIPAIDLLTGGFASLFGYKAYGYTRMAACSIPGLPSATFTRWSFLSTYVTVVWYVTAYVFLEFKLHDNLPSSALWTMLGCATVVSYSRVMPKGWWFVSGCYITSGWIDRVAIFLSSAGLGMLWAGIIEKIYDAAGDNSVPASLTPGGKTANAGAPGVSASCNAAPSGSNDMVCSVYKNGKKIA